MQDSFRDIGASEEIVQSLLSMGIGRPSHVQAAAYRALNAGDSSYVVLADHAGAHVPFQLHGVHSHLTPKPTQEV